MQIAFFLRSTDYSNVYKLVVPERKSRFIPSKGLSVNPLDEGQMSFVLRLAGKSDKTCRGQLAFNTQTMS